MDELISRKTLIKRFKKKKEQASTLRDAFYLDCVMAVIDTAPAIESEPVRYGKWIKEELDFYYECSECGGKWHEQWIRSKFLKYCPDCGCKMDLEATNET